LINPVNIQTNRQDLTKDCHCRVITETISFIKPKPLHTLTDTRL